MDNAYIIEKCVDGDKEAMGLLYRRYAHRMMRLIRRYVADEQAVKDILHDGFIVVLTHIGDVRYPEKLEFWMGTIMKKLSVKYLSQLDVMTILDEDADFEDTGDIEEILSYKELEEIINRLPDGYRRIFKLAVLENKSHKEIGALLGIAPHSSSSQLHRAKALLRKMINERKAELGLLGIICIFSLAFLTLKTNEGKPVVEKISENVNASRDSEALPGPETPEPIPFRIPVGTKSAVKSVMVSATQPSVAEGPAEAGDSVPHAESAGNIDVAENALASENIPINETDSIADRQTAIREYEEMMAARREEDEFCPEAPKSRGGWTASLHSGLSGGLSLPSQGDNDCFASADPGSWSQPVTPDYSEDVSHSIPISAGISFSRRIWKGLSVETGVMYSLLRTHISCKGTGLTAKQKYTTSYLGIPIKLNYRIWRKNNWSIYGTVSGQADFVVGNGLKTTYLIGNAKDYPLYRYAPKTQFSVGAGIGFQVSVSRNVSFYAEPSVKYYFDNGSSLTTYWQEHPFWISLPLGIRFNW